MVVSWNPSDQRQWYATGSVKMNASLPEMRWALPLAGGLLFSVLVGLWLTSALWFIDKNGFPAL